jgi:hypothetical protein
MKRQTTVKKTKDWSTRTLSNKNDNKTENSSPCNAIGSKHSKRNYAEDDPFCYAWLVCSEVLRWPLRLVKLYLTICVADDHGYVPFVVVTSSSFFLMNHRIFLQEYGATFCSGTVYISGLPEFIMVLSWVCVAQSFAFCVVFCRTLCGLILLDIVLYVLRFPQFILHPL